MGDYQKHVISIELLVKMIKPDASDTVYVDGIVVCEEEVYITDVGGQKVFGMLI